MSSLHVAFGITCGVIFGLVLTVMPIGYGQSIPDYYNPYAPIITDKSVYTWTEKVHLKIIAPSWNENRLGIDSIGGDPEYSIRISTSRDSLDEYRLVETHPNSGVFTGSIILSGFAHDIDGDRTPDITPRTFGSGPNDGLLQVDRDSAVTISFEFADGVILSESFMISWNIGQVHLDDNTVRVIDPDMNIDPETLDQVEISIYSDSDPSGVSLHIVETAPSSGVFVGDIPISDSSEYNTLYVVPGDEITVQYDDYTVPEPYSKSDVLSIKVSSHYGIVNMPIENLAVVVDDNVTSGLQTMIVGSVRNTIDRPQDFVHLIQISRNDTVVSLGWITGTFSPKQTLTVSHSWLPDRPGSYTVDSFVWRSLDKPTAIASTISTVLDVR